MFGVKVLIEKLNSAINAGTLPETQLAQAFGAIESLEKQGVSSVFSTSFLPAAARNKGRFFWVENIQRYVVSNGTTWSNDNIFGVSYLNLYSWGHNNNGQLGDNTTSNRISPVAPIAARNLPGTQGEFNDWVQVNPGYRSTIALRSNGTLWTWGNNSHGSLGDNTNINRSSPVSVVGGFTDWVSADITGHHGIGLRANGTLWSWGRNTNGTLGNGAVGVTSSPGLVLGGFTDWTGVSCSSLFNLALRANGTLWGWGTNQYGQVGDGTTSGRSSPVSVVGGFTDWIFADAGGINQPGNLIVHSVAIRSNGVLYAWGRNNFGQLGDGTTSNRSSPVSVVGGFTDWIQASGGGDHSLGLRSNGTLWSWGKNTFGQLGDGTTSNRSSPVSVVGGFTDWIQASGGVYYSLGLRSNGTAWAWGRNTYGQLGDNTASQRSSPVSVVGGFTDWVYIAGGASEHSLGIRG